MSRRSTIIKGLNPLDPDAAAFLSAAGITDATITGAINTLVVDLKAAGIWSKMKAIYPFVGGTATTHKFNLKDPQDTNAAFRLVFNGGWTHSANGALPNGTNAWADTHLNQLSHINVNSQHMSYYSRSDTRANTTFRIEVGITATHRNNLGVHRTYFNVNDRITSDIATTSALGAGIVENSNDSRGFYIANRTSNIRNIISRNGAISAVNTDNWGITTSLNFNYFIGTANSSGTPASTSYTNRQCAFSSIGDGLTDTEIANFYTAVQAFQTTLNRQV